jgi:hypothetical protein
LQKISGYIGPAAIYVVQPPQPPGKTIPWYHPS